MTEIIIFIFIKGQYSSLKDLFLFDWFIKHASYQNTCLCSFGSEMFSLLKW